MVDTIVSVATTDIPNDTPFTLRAGTPLNRSYGGSIQSGVGNITIPEVHLAGVDYTTLTAEITLDGTVLTPLTVGIVPADGVSITGPAASATLASGTLTITWSDGGNALIGVDMHVDLAPYNNSVYNNTPYWKSGTTTAKTLTVSVPTDGSLIYIRMYYQLPDGTWGGSGAALAEGRYIDRQVTAHTEVTFSGSQFYIPSNNVAEGSYDATDWAEGVAPLNATFWESNGTPVTTISTVAGRRALGVRLDGTSTPSTRVGAGADLPPGDKYTFEQWVYFDPSFDWGGTEEGGKLGFGLGGGSVKGGGEAGPSDTDTQTGFTSRFMWRTNGALAAYVYEAQTVGFGDDHDLNVVAPRGEWFKLKMEVIMNSAGGVADGKLRCWYNGALKVDRSNMEWFGTGTPQIDTLIHFTFHGGNTSAWTPSRVNHVYYSNIFWGAGDAEDVGLLPPNLIAPAPGTALTSGTHDFTWSLRGRTDIERIVLKFGNSVGGSEYGAIVITDPTTLTHTQSGLPTNGSRLEVEFSYRVSGSYTDVQYHYTAWTDPVGPVASAFNEAQPYGGLFYGHAMAAGKFPSNTYRMRRHFLRFRADKGGHVQAASFEVRIGPSYSTKTGGVIKYAIFADDGTANHYPDLTGTIYGESDGTFVPGDNSLNTFYEKEMDMINTVPLVAGRSYHLGIINLDPSNGVIPTNGANILLRDEVRYQSWTRESLGPWFDQSSAYQISDNGTGYGPMTDVDFGGDGRARDIVPAFAIQYADGSWHDNYFTNNDYPSSGDAGKYDTSRSNPVDSKREVVWINDDYVGAQPFTVSGGDRVVNGLWSHYGHHRNGGYPDGSPLIASIVRDSDGAVLATAQYSRDLELYETTLEVNETGNEFLDYQLHMAGDWAYSDLSVSSVTLVNGVKYRVEYSTADGGNYMMFVTPCVRLGDSEKNFRGEMHFTDGEAARKSSDGGSTFPTEVDTARNWGGKLGMLFTTVGNVKDMKDYVPE